MRPDTIKSAKYPAGISYCGRDPHQVDIFVRMFTSTTAVLSGAERYKTRNLEMCKSVWADRLYGLYPSFLREFLYFNEEALATAKRRLADNSYVSEFQFSLLAAHEQASKRDPEEELEERTQEVKCFFRFLCFLAILLWFLLVLCFRL